jgi:NAD(P)-dependent dehydrogenase (short-subunit alcohol dehydrogenase family)
MGKLEGKVAIVTGSGRSLGRGIALALASEGASVVVCGRTPELLDDTAKEIAGRGGRSIAVPCDVSRADSVADLVSRSVDAFGTIDILVNNAQSSHCSDTLLVDVDDEEFEAGFRSGPLATLRMMRACHPYLCGGGVIINLGTGASLRPDPVGYGAYGAIKEGIRALSRSAACEWGKDGIRVHTIVPLAGLDAWAEAYPEQARAYFATIPLGRVGDAERDVGRVVVFLCGPDSGYMTGNTICVDGGQAFLH